MMQATDRHILANRRWFGLVLVLILACALPASAQLNQTFHNDGWILAAAHAPGLHGSIWRTDLWINVEDVAEGTWVELFFNRTSQDNYGTVGKFLSLTPGTEVYYIEDVVDHFLDLNGAGWVGAIHYISNARVQVWARVYSVSADGKKSFGQLVEGIPSADATPDSNPWDYKQQQWLYAMKHTADDRFRVNVGVVNPTSVASQYGISIYTADGSLRGSKSVTVPRYSMVQLVDPFADINGGEWNNYIIRVTCETDGGKAFAYAAVVDNATNDSYFVRAVKALGPDE